MHDQSILSDIMGQWEAARAKGETLAPEELCRDHPELLEPMRRRIAIREAAPPKAGAETAAESPSSATVSNDLPEIPGYEVLGILGRGGMGVVYKARHLTLKRVVALKMIRSAAQAGAQEIARFHIEAEAVAKLQHPNIVQIHDVGTHGSCPYFALEYVAGGSLDRKIAGRLLPPRRVAELIETLARAMHYAHEQGIVHRDLKPGNILLEASGSPDVDFSPQAVKVTDFGLAKFYGNTEGGQTATGDVLGSPSYMAPEQAAGKIKEIGPATDVYALGAILYELLTGRAPFQSETIWDTIAQVIQQDPVPPSQIQLKTPPDLETICLRCLEKSPAKRFASAQALADDLRRYLDGLPILARPVGRVERIVKWGRRRPALASLIAVSVLGVASLLTLGILYSLDLREANTAIAKERDNAQAAEKATKEQYEKSRSSLFDLQLAFVKMVHENDPGRGLALLDDAERCPADLRDFSWGLFRNICKRDRIVQTHEREARSLAWLKNGGWLAATDAAGRLKVWDVQAAAEVDFPTAERAGFRIAGSTRGNQFATGRVDGAIRIWNLKERKEPISLNDHGTPIAALAMSADGATFASAGTDGTIVVRVGQAFRPDEPVKTVARKVDGIAALALTPDGKRLAVACDAGIRVWDLSTDKEIPGPKGSPGLVTSLAFFPDGSRLAACDHDGVAQWWDVEKWRPRGRFAVPRTILLTLAVSADGKSLALAGMDGVIRVIDAANDSGAHVVLAGHQGPVWSLAFSPDGKSLASAGQDRTVRIWDLRPRLESATLERKSPILSAAFSPNGAILATGGKDGGISLWQRDTGKRLKTFAAGQGAVTSLAFAPKDDVLASAGGDGSIRVWNLATDAAPTILTGHDKAVLSIAFSPDGTTLGSAGQDGSVRLWDWREGRERLRENFGDVLWSLAFSPDGGALAVGGADGKVYLCDSSAKPTFTMPQRKGGVYSVAFSPDGRTLAAGGTDHAIELWDWPERVQKLVLTGPRHSIRAVAFPPDGRTLASIADDGHLRLWDLVTGQERISLPMPSEAGSGTLFSPDGRTLAAFGQSKIVLWDAAVRR